MLKQVQLNVPKKSTLTKLKIKPLSRPVSPVCKNIFQKQNNIQGINIKKVKSYHIVGHTQTMNYLHNKSSQQKKLIKRIQTGKSLRSEKSKRNSLQNTEKFILKKSDLLNRRRYDSFNTNLHENTTKQYTTHQKKYPTKNTLHKEHTISKIKSEFKKYKNYWQNKNNNFSIDILKIDEQFKSHQNNKFKKYYHCAQMYRKIWQQKQKRAYHQVKQNGKLELWQKNLRSSSSISQQLESRFYNIDSITKNGLTLNGHNKYQRQIQWVQMKNQDTIFVNYLQTQLDSGGN